MKQAPSNLARALQAGHFAMTAETSPPDAASAQAVIDRVTCLKGLADAVNVTDGASARVHMSAFAAATIMAREGIEPVLQLTTRDRNRIALQGDVVGASALGIHNFLCLTGDKMSAGDQPDAAEVFEMDSGELMRQMRDMRDNGSFPSGRKIDPAPSLFLGAAEMPAEPGENWPAARLQAKIDNGTQFFQTQYCFELEKVKRYCQALVDGGFTEQAYFLIGIGPLASARSALWMNENLFGVHIPDNIIERLEGAADQKAEGRAICAELLQAFSEIEGCAGAHLMAPHGEASCAQVIRESGLLEIRN
ncbi:MAG: methylenetetrahydrofolate reductase [Gammaproteobacteria bacterium]|nr:methylenetetrahydrofolate reductase [Gammaproteobacteria bacterium]MDH3446774.1 methylenetetrahydrofolate reductase [Gammaproteobacteria bacterium]